MSGPSIWDTLGVAPTPDVGEIRRAYAARLKVTNPEDDADGFQALRQAYEFALRYARHAAWAEADKADDAAQDGEADERDAADRRAPPVEPDPIPSPARPLDPIEADRLRLLSDHAATCEALWRMLVENAAADRMQAGLGAVLASPALQFVSVQADTEIWLARSIANWGAKADPLVDGTVRHFNWRASERAWDLPPEVLAVLERHNQLLLLTTLGRKADPRHQAFKTLLRPPSSLNPIQRALLGGHARPVRDLLADFRRNRPALMDSLDPEAVAWWDRYLSRGHFPWQTAGWLAAAFLTIFVLSALTGTLSPRAPMATGTLEALKARVISHPEDTTNQIELCRQRGRTGQELDQALNDCNMLAIGDRESLAAREGLALVKMRLGRFLAAATDYAEILKVSPHDARALHGHGLALLRMGDPKGKADFDLAQSIDPATAATYRGYGLLPTVSPTGNEIVGVAGAPPPVSPPAIRIRLPRTAKLTPIERVKGPTQAEVSAVFPERARREGKSGRVLMQCHVSVEGELEDCIIWSETPPDYGFADAVLKLRPLFRFTPFLVDGRPDPRAVVTLPFAFRFADKAVVISPPRTADRA